VRDKFKHNKQILKEIIELKHLLTNMAKEIARKLELSGVLGGVNPIYKCFTWSK